MFNTQSKLLKQLLEINYKLINCARQKATACIGFSIDGSRQAKRAYQSVPRLLMGGYIMALSKRGRQVMALSGPTRF